MKNKRNELEAMPVIINIQMMQEIIHGKKSDHSAFKNYSIYELREMHDNLIPYYNAAIKEKNEKK